MDTPRISIVSLPETLKDGMVRVEEVADPVVALALASTEMAA